MDLPDFSGLPDWAQGVLYTIAALSIGVTIIVPRMGFLFGKGKGPAVDAVPAPVAAVIVDPTALNRHSDAVTTLANNLAKFGEQLDDFREELRVQAASAGRPRPRG